MLRIHGNTERVTLKQHLTDWCQTQDALFKCVGVDNQSDARADIANPCRRQSDF